MKQKEQISHRLRQFLDDLGEGNLHPIDRMPAWEQKNSKGSGESVIEALLLRIAVAITVINKDYPLRLRETQQLFNDSESFLQLASQILKPGSLEFLTGQLMAIKAQYLERDGRYQESLHHYLKALHFAKAASHDDKILLHEKVALCQYHLRHHENFLLINPSDAKNWESCQATYMLTGKSQNWDAFPEDAKLWIIKVQNQKPDPSLAIIFGKGTQFQPGLHFIFKALYLSHLSSNQTIRRRLLSVDMIKRKYSALIKTRPVFQHYMAVAQALDEATDVEIPKTFRIDNLLKALALVDRFMDAEDELLALGALGCKLQFLGQDIAFSTCYSRYEDKTLQYTGGRSRDLYHLNPTVPTYNSQMNTLQRLWQIGKTGYQIKGLLQKRKPGHPDHTDILQQAEMIRTLEILGRNAGALKGIVNKIYQLTSFMALEGNDQVLRNIIPVLPDVRPMAKEVVRQIIAEQLQERASDIRNLSDLPIATGSIGQVHYGELPDGRQVAVKIQYPNIRKALKTDLMAVQILKLLLPRQSKAFKATVNSFITEFERLMYLEIDYQKEAENQNKFRKIFANDPHIHIPEVFTDYSTGRVLVMELAQGMPLHEFVQNSSQEEKNRAGEAIFAFNTISMLDHGNFNCDPHPDNYLFSSKGVTFLDFGCVTQLPESLLSAIREVYRTCHRDDAESLTAWNNYLVIEDLSTFDVGAQNAILRATHQGFVTSGPFTYSPEIIANIRKLFWENPNRENIQFRKEMVPVVRLLYGSLSLVGYLNASFDHGGISDKAQMGFARTMKSIAAGEIS